MSNKLDQFILRLKPELGIAIKISFSIFLFILFFQPFSLNESDFNNRLLRISGFSLILFISIVLVRVFSSMIFDRYRKVNEEAIFPVYINGIVIFLLSSVAFAFYGYYVGGIGFNFIVALRIVIICLFPPVILAVSDSFRGLKHIMKHLLQIKKISRSRLKNSKRIS